RDDQQRSRLSLFDRSQQPWRRLASLEGVSQARFDARRHRVLFTRFTAGGLWQADPALTQASVHQISDDAPSRWRYRTWTSSGDGYVDYLDSTMTCATRLVRFGEESAPLERCLDVRRLTTANGFSASPDGQQLFVPLAVTDGAGIGIMDL